MLKKLEEKKEDRMEFTTLVKFMNENQRIEEVIGLIFKDFIEKDDEELRKGRR